MAKYTLKKLAEIDFEKIWHYTAKKWGVKQAIKYTNELEKVFLILADNPLMCRERFEFEPPVRIHHHGSHLIIYLMREDEHIIIARVLHENMDIDAQLQ
jgi:toxin ParE1/3/4